jgi:hypothetical protein
MAAPPGINAAYAHLLVLRHIPVALRNAGALSDWVEAESGFAGNVLRFHDETTAILCFPDAQRATLALPKLDGASRLGEKFRQDHERQSPLGALPTCAPSRILPASTSHSPRHDQPFPTSSSSARPLKDAAVAQRLIRGAMGSVRMRGGTRDAASSQEGYLRPAPPLPSRSDKAHWRTSDPVEGTDAGCSQEGTEDQPSRKTQPAAPQRTRLAFSSSTFVPGVGLEQAQYQPEGEPPSPGDSREEQLPLAPGISAKTRGRGAQGSSSQLRRTAE